MILINKTLLFILLSTLIPVQSNLWDNIYSQTQASHPIMLTESFNINIPLPEDLQFDANLDFNSDLKILTLKLSKTLLVQKVQFLKAQLDLQTLMINVEQLLLGCQKLTFALPDQASGNLQQTIQGVNVSKKQLFLINLLFKYIGKYSKKNQTKQQGIEAGIMDILKGNKFFDSIVDSGVLGDEIKNNKGSEGGKQRNKSSEEKDWNIFEFSGDIFKDSQELIDKIKEAKDVAGKDLQMEEIGEVDLKGLDLEMIKFVIVTDGRTGDVVKAYRNKEMREELELSLKSNEKKRVECNKEAKRLGLEDLREGAKYLVENKDSLGI